MIKFIRIFVYWTFMLPALICSVPILIWIWSLEDEDKKEFNEPDEE